VKLSVKLPIAMMGMSAVTGVMLALIIMALTIVNTYLRLKEDSERYAAFAKNYIDSKGLCAIDAAREQLVVKNPFSVFGVQIAIFDLDRASVLATSSTDFMAWRAPFGSDDWMDVAEVSRGGHVTSYITLHNDKGMVVAYVGISLSAKGYIKDLYADMASIFAVLCGCLAASWLIGIYLSNGLTRPIGHLLKAVASMESGDFSPIQISYNSEIGQLGHKFNQLQHTLCATMRDLREKNKEMQSAIDSLSREQRENERLTAALAQVVKGNNTVMEATRRRVVNGSAI
jgi:methyl-accepting chemotaxis protein